MIKLRKREDRGHFDHGWLDTQHTFSFGGYRDPEQMGFRSLRVINEDRVSPGQGFGTHSHRDMEIISYVLDGALEHRDSMGNGSVLRRGMLQRMSAGTGIQHSEFNHSSLDPVHFYQIWLLPERDGLEPSYEELDFNGVQQPNQFQLVASRDGRAGALTLHQDAELHLAKIEPGQAVAYAPHTGRHAWVQVLRGGAKINGHVMQAGDGVAVSEESTLTVQAEQEAEVLLFDLA
jgi:redox-sensitive bicupin YhaK (pirin superfamily)